MIHDCLVTENSGMENPYEARRVFGQQKPSSKHQQVRDDPHEARKLRRIDNDLNSRDALLLVDNGTKVYEEETSAYLDKQLYAETAESHENYQKSFVPLVTDKNTRFMRARKTQQELFKQV